MASKFFRTHVQQFQKKALLSHHKKLIEQHYDFICCRFVGNTLVFNGLIKEDYYKNNYKFEIRCVAGFAPKCSIIEPADIIPSADIHMFEDHSVCLYYPEDTRWHGLTPIYQFTIPWLVEWIHFYELYLINGFKWEGRESPVHITEADKNISQDVENQAF